MTAKDIESILWLIPAIPLAAALLNGLLGIVFLRSKAKKDLTRGQLTIRYATSFIGITAIVSALVISVICLLYLIGQPAPHSSEEQKNAPHAAAPAMVARSPESSGALKLAAPPVKADPPPQTTEGQKTETGAAEAENARRVEVKQVYTWISSGDFQIKFGFLLDPLTAVMLIVVCTISLLV